MSMFHSTVSRRDFMKGLGLGAAAIGGVGLVAPVFHDLDELTASGESKIKRAWWVKEVDEPTVEIDWSIMKRHHGGHSTQSSAVVARYPGLEAYNAMKKTEKSDADRMKDNEPGYRLRDAALSGGAISLSGGSTASWWEAGWAAKRSQEGSDTTWAWMPSAASRSAASTQMDTSLPVPTSTTSGSSTGRRA